MKFVIAVVVLALALGAQSGLVPLSYAASPLSYAASPLTYTAVSSPGYYAAAPGSVAVHASAYSAPVVGTPIVSAYSAPVVSAYSTYAAPAIAAPGFAAPALVSGEGSYVAQTRGAVHVAPLPGHANSAASINLQPAPGTL